MLHLRGETPETLAAAFPGLPLAVARRVLHRVVGEDREDLAGKSLLRVLRGRLGLEEVSDARFSLVWLVELNLGGPEARALADSIAMATSWRRGLLANPHSQTADVFEARTYLGGGEAR